MKYKFGIACLLLSFISPLFSFIVPFFDFSTETKITLGTFFLIGLPEILFIIGAFLAGKKVTNQLMKKLKTWYAKKT